MFYPVSLYSAICQFHLSKTGGGDRGAGIILISCKNLNFETLAYTIQTNTKLRLPVCNFHVEDMTKWPSVPFRHSNSMTFMFIRNHSGLWFFLLECSLFLPPFPNKNNNFIYVVCHDYIKCFCIGHLF